MHFLGLASLEEHLEECRQRRVMGNAAPSSGMLAVLMVVMLVSGWTEGSMLSKCEMKSQLEAAFKALKSGAANDDLAKLVCTVEAASRFNTSLVTIIDPSRPGRLIRHGFSIDRSSTQEVIGDYFPEMLPKETLVTENPFSSPEVVMEDDGTSLIPERLFSTQGTKELSIPLEAVIEDFIPASPEPEERLADASAQDNNPSEGNPTESVDRQGWNHREENVKIDEISAGEGSGEIIDFSADYSGQSSKEEPSGDEPLHLGIRFSEGSGGYTEEPLVQPISTPEYPIDESFYPDSDIGPGSSDYTGEPIDLDGIVLYGIFQLSDDVACQSESKYSQNLCRLDCKDLINDDISDDIECLMTLKEQMVEMTFTEECRIVELSSYFETCD
ncbi:hypothetical protein AOLI_G00236750 [Acnodon oligacanthus]